MPDTFSVRLDDLEHVATNLLPAVADDIDNAYRELKGTIGAQDAAFSGELYSSVGETWEELRRAFEDILHNNHETVQDSAAALSEIVRRYRAADDAAAGRLS
jgi:uncharacterized protein YukE